MVNDDMQTDGPVIPDAPKQRPGVAVLGLGRAGGRVVTRLAALPQSARMELAVADTDAGALAECRNVRTILLGEDWTDQTGCGGDIAVGEHAAGGGTQRLSSCLRGVKQLFVVAGLGGGTGAGASKVVARLVRDAGLPAFFFLTLPFSFEGNWRGTNAKAALEELRNLADVAIAIPNDLLFSVLSADAPAAQAFAEADRVLAESIAGLAGMTSSTPLVPVDYAGIRTALRERPAVCGVGVGHGHGPRRWQQALEALFEAPLSGGRKALEKADGAIVALMGGPDLAVGEIQTALQGFQRACHPGARILAGAFADPELKDEVLLTAIHFTHTERQSKQEDSRSAPLERPERKRARRGKSRPDPKSGTDLQGELPLLEQTLGIFAGCAPTTFRGDNLDIPTFQRRGTILDTGD